MRILVAICIGVVVLAVASILTLFVLPSDVSGSLAFAYCALAPIGVLGLTVWALATGGRR